MSGLREVGAGSIITVSLDAEISLQELLEGGAQEFASRLRSKLEEELKIILDIPWSKVEVEVAVAPPQPPVVGQR